MRFGQETVLITSITPGVDGNSVPIAKVLTLLVPHPFVALTVIEPFVKPGGYVKDILLVP